jgi:hypothetical protein
MNYSKAARVGERVMFRRDLQTLAGILFKRGEAAVVVKRFKGLELKTDDGRRIKFVLPDDVVVLE